MGDGVSRGRDEWQLSLRFFLILETLRETPESVVRLSEQGRLTELPGVGDTISDKVGELIANGRIAALEKLVAATPPGVVPLMRVPGVGPKTAKRVFSELGVETVDEVLQAARDGRIQGLAGMGERTEQAILAGLESPRAEKRERISVARLRPFAERIVAELKLLPGVAACEIAGSALPIFYRRSSIRTGGWSATIDETMAKNVSGFTAAPRDACS